MGTLQSKPRLVGGKTVLISLTKYAESHGKAAKSVRDMAQRGRFQTDQKIGRNWVIDSDEPYPDARIKSGNYIGRRKKQGR